MKKIDGFFFLFIAAVFALFLFAGASAPPPGASSGNGNPMILLVFLLLPLGGLLAAFWIAFLRRFAVKPVVYVVSAAALASHLAIAFLYRRQQISDYRDVVRQAVVNSSGMVDEAYVTAITTGISIHINHHNFNVNTFLMFVSFTLLAACLYRLWDLWEAR